MKKINKGLLIVAGIYALSNNSKQERNCQNLIDGSQNKIDDLLYNGPEAYYSSKNEIIKGKNMQCKICKEAGYHYHQKDCIIDIKRPNIYYPNYGSFDPKNLLHCPLCMKHKGGYHYHIITKNKKNLYFISIQSQ